MRQLQVIGAVFYKEVSLDERKASNGSVVKFVSLIVQIVDQDVFILVYILISDYAVKKFLLRIPDKCFLPFKIGFVNFTSCH